MKTNIIQQGKAKQVLQDLPDQSINTCVTSPPYWGLRDYGVEGQLGLEDTPEEYVDRLVGIFSEVRRVLRDDGTLWLNLGDSYAHPNTGGQGATGGRDKSTLQSSMPPKNTTPTKKSMPPDLKPKDLVGIPWRVAFALQDDGWYLRNDIIWHKPNPMPESVTDRCTTSHEHIFLLAKSEKYYYDHEAIKEPTKSPTQERKRANGVSVEEQGKRNGKGNITANCGVGEKKNKRDVWTIALKSFPEAHFAVYPPDLIKPCVKAGCPENGVVLDPFFGAGTTGLVAKELGRNYVGIELNEDYIEIAEDRLSEVQVALI